MGSPYQCERVEDSILISQEGFELTTLIWTSSAAHLITTDKLRRGDAKLEQFRDECQRWEARLEPIRATVPTLGHPSARGC